LRVFQLNLIRNFKKGRIKRKGRKQKKGREKDEAEKWEEENKEEYNICSHVLGR
jgi:hypothetical protein